MTDNKHEAMFHNGHDPSDLAGVQWNDTSHRDAHYNEQFSGRQIRPENLSPVSPAWPAQPPGIFMQASVKPASGAATWALVTGIIGLLVGWCLFGLPSIAAVILGHIGERQTKDDRTTGRGMAVTGLVLGYVGIIPGIILTFWMIAGMGAAAVSPPPSIAPATTVSAAPSSSFREFSPGPLPKVQKLRANPEPSPSAVEAIETESDNDGGPYYANCTQMREDYPHGVKQGSPEYRSACEVTR